VPAFFAAGREVALEAGTQRPRSQQCRGNARPAGRSTGVLIRAAINCVLCTFILGGCQLLDSMQGRTTPPPPGTSLPPAPDEVPQDPRIIELLDQARSAFEARRFTTPLEDNAYLRYAQILAIDPDNEAAMHGMGDIVEAYLDWAIEAATAGRVAAARDYLRKATSVDETHPNVAAVRQMIDERQQSRQKHYAISRGALVARAASLASRLRIIADEVTREDATIVIHARTDADGRWIYQRMNESTDARIRAVFRTQSRPAVDLIY
jgi:tetratricopeptide (TPR) repeat protein